MDFDNIFSTTDMFGMVMKLQLKNNLRNTFKDNDDEYAITTLKVIIECCDELIKERQGEI